MTSSTHGLRTWKRSWSITRISSRGRKSFATVMTEKSMGNGRHSLSISPWTLSILALKNLLVSPTMRTDTEWSMSIVVIRMVTTYRTILNGRWVNLMGMETFQMKRDAKWYRNVTWLWQILRSAYSVTLWHNLLSMVRSSLSLGIIMQ